MGIPVLILGESGSGKSTSLRNFEQEEIGIFNVASKPLPFRKKLPTRNGATYASITKDLSHPKGRTYAIDDSQALMAFALFNKAKETGYGKFTDIALDFYNLLQFIIQKTPSDCIVYFLHHTETSDTGKIKAKTVGKTSSLLKGYSASSCWPVRMGYATTSKRSRTASPQPKVLWTCSPNGKSTMT